MRYLVFIWGKVAVSVIFLLFYALVIFSFMSLEHQISIAPLICNNTLLQLKTSELFTEVIVGDMRVDKIIKEE